MEMKKGYDLKLHRAMALMGGFFGGYMILSRANCFGNAQTMNLIDLVVAVLGRDIREVFFRTGILFVYVLAIVLFVLYTDSGRKKGRIVSVFIDGIALGIMGLIPGNVNPLWVVYPCAFAMAFQWCAFPGAKEYASSTVFNSNNTKQTTMAFTRYILHKKEGDLEKACFFLGTLLFFHLGIAFSYFGVKMLGTKGAFLGIIFLFYPLALTIKECREDEILFRN